MPTIISVFEERSPGVALVADPTGAGAGYVAPVLPGARRYFELGSNPAADGGVGTNRELNNVIANVYGVIVAPAVATFRAIEAQEVDGRGRIVFYADSEGGAGHALIAVRIRAFEQVNATGVPAVGNSWSDAMFVSIEDGVTTLAAFLAALTGGVQPAGIPATGAADPVIAAGGTGTVLGSASHSISGKSRIILAIGYDAAAVPVTPLP